MNTIRWGIIGCGNVTEVKSGPGFQKAQNSSLVAVMRRNGQLAQDYAQRHGVPKWYDNGQALIDDEFRRVPGDDRRLPGGGRFLVCSLLPAFAGSIFENQRAD
jgi:hypothetical protein